MARWFTADPHFGHANIIKYCNRPFSDVDEMNDRLVANWNGVVGDDDTVWLVGDFGLGKIDQTLEFVHALNGSKILVAGNHDRCWDGHGRKAEGWTDRYLEAGFDEVLQGHQSVSIGRQKVVVSHFPYRHADSQDDRYAEHRPVDKGAWLIHGHVHDLWSQRGRQINVGVDTTGFRPVNDTDIAAIIDAGPVDQS